MIRAGVKISNPTKFWEKWNLDLGAGNILKKEANVGKTSHYQWDSQSHPELQEKKKESMENKVINLPKLPPQGIRKIRNPRKTQNIRYTPCPRPTARGAR